MINEILPSKRRDFIIVPALWFGTAKPQIEVFLKPFSGECLTLETNGYLWYHNQKKNGKHELSKVINLICSVDSVARASVQNMKKYNGGYG